MQQEGQTQSAVSSSSDAADMEEDHVEDSNLGEDNSGENLQVQISTGYCSMAELYTTDLCDEPEAESEVERLLNTAESVCQVNAEVYYSQANLRLIQGREEESKACIQKCLDIINSSDDNLTSTNFEVKTNIAKICVELMLFEEAVNLLEMLLREDDRYAELWYLTGLSYRQLEDDRTAYQYLKRAATMLEIAESHVGIQGEADASVTEFNDVQANIAQLDLKNDVLQEIDQISEEDKAQSESDFTS